MQTHLSNLIGSSPSFLAMLQQMARVAATDAPVLLEGETGTGKEIVARAIHYGGQRCDRPFVPANLRIHSLPGLDSHAAAGALASPAEGMTKFQVAKARAIERFERTYVTELLSITNGNLSEAARVSGKERSRLGKLVRKYGLQREAFSAVSRTCVRLHD